MVPCDYRLAVGSWSASTCCLFGRSPPVHECLLSPPPLLPPRGRPSLTTEPLSLSPPPLAKRWAFAADALEEVCPGACDQAYWDSACELPASEESHGRDPAGGGGGGGGGSGAGAAGFNVAGGGAPTQPVVVQQPGGPGVEVSVEVASPADVIPHAPGAVLRGRGLEDVHEAAVMEVSPTSSAATVDAAEAAANPLARPGDGDGDGDGDEGGVRTDRDPSQARGGDSSVRGGSSGVLSGGVPTAAAVPVASVVPRAGGGAAGRRRRPVAPAALLPVSKASIVEVATAFQDFRFSVSNTRRRAARGRASSGGVGEGANPSEKPIPRGPEDGPQRGFGANGEAGRDPGSSSANLRGSARASPDAYDQPLLPPPGDLLDPMLAQVVEYLGRD